MVKPGPKPTPTSLKLFRGESRPSRLNAREPMPRCDAPDPPSWLAREAKAEWRRIVKALPGGLLTGADRQVLSVLADAWSRWYLATKDVRDRGILVEGERGMVKNPALQVARDAEGTMRQCWAEIGLSPAARARLEMPRPPGNDETLASRYLS